MTNVRSAAPGTLAETPRYWWQEPGNIARLLRYLESHEGLDVRDAIAIVEKPWHWDPEFQEMCDVQSKGGVL